MKRLGLLLGLDLLLAGCGGAAAPATTSAPTRPAASASAKPAASIVASATGGAWDDIVTAARKEGKVEVIVGPGTNFREGVQPFTTAYPGIELNAKGEHIRDALPRILRERQGGVYSTDVMIGAIGAGVFDQWIPQGVLDPLEPALLLPEVKDDSKWRGGLSGAWEDKAKKYIFGFISSAQPSIVYVNRDGLPESDLPGHITANDLMNPKLKGKIVWDDPRELGSGVNLATLLMKSQGEDFLRRLLSDQQPVLSRDPRQQVEWLIRGTYPVGLSIDQNELERLRSQGLGKNVVKLEMDLGVVTAIPKFGTVARFNKAPHPNAAIMFVNWLLSKEGQTAFTAKVRDENSRRLDVPPVSPDEAVQPGVQYVDSQSEEFAPIRARAAEVARAARP